MSKKKSRILERLDEINEAQPDNKDPVDEEIRAICKNHAKLLKAFTNYKVKQKRVTVSDGTIRVHITLDIEVDVDGKLSLAPYDSAISFCNKRLGHALNAQDGFFVDGYVDLEELDGLGFDEDPVLQKTLEAFNTLNAVYKALPKKEREVIAWEIDHCC